MWLYWQLFVVGLRLLGRERQDLVLENIVLRQQLAIHEHRGHRAKLKPADRRFWSVTSRSWVRWRSHVRIVQPENVHTCARCGLRYDWRKSASGCLKSEGVAEAVGVDVGDTGARAEALVGDDQALWT